MSKKIYTAIMVLTLLIAGAAAAFGISRSAKEASVFWGDGYVLSFQNGENGAVVPEPVYFTAGTRYKTSYDGRITFQDMYGKKQQISADAFIHYADESVSTFHSGVVMEMNELSKGLLNYYSLGADSIMNRQGEGYLLDNQGTPLEFQDYVWKIQEDRFLVSSPELLLTMPDGTEEKLSGYLELEYIDKGIVRLSNAERAFQMLAMGSSLRLSDGSVLHLEDRSVEKDGQVSLYLPEILLDELAGSNIPVVPSETKPVKVPTFDITTIDGEEGQAGLAGETGETGEAGEEGKSGDAGEAGEEGEEGDEGEEGEEGQDGDEGAEGDSGSDGKSGEAGAAGATGGTGGGGGGTGGNADKVVMPVYVLSEFVYDITKASGTIDVDNAEDVNGVEMTGGTLSIMDTLDNTVIDSESYDADTLSSFSRLEFSTDKLDPDQKYKLMFKASYLLTGSEEGTDSQGERTFLTRTFSTTSFGILESYLYATENSLAVTLEKLEYAGDGQVRVILFDKDGQQQDLITVNAADWTGSGKSKSYKAEFVDLTSNSGYTVRVEVLDSATGAYVEVSESEYRTLKKAPQIKKPPIVANNPKGYFEIRPELGTEADPGIVDPDHAITAYRYDVYTYVGDKPGTLVAQIYGEGTSATAIYIDGENIQRNVDYVARLVAEYNDNEKIIETESDWTEAFFMGENTGVPYLVFQPDEAAGGVNYDQIIGNLTVELNGAPLEIGDFKNLTLTVYHDQFGEKPYYVWSERPDNLEKLTVPVRLTGLNANTTYRFNLHGYYKDEAAARLLATTIVKTPASNTMRAVMRETSKMGESVHPLNAEIWFEYGNDVESRLEGGQYEAHKIQNIRLTLTQGSQRYTADLDDFTITPTKTEVKNPDFPNADPIVYTKLESNFPEKCFNQDGNSEPKGRLVIDNTDFNLADDAVTGSNYTLRIEYLNDYTAIDEYRYQSDYTKPNQIMVTDNELELKPAETMPDLPKDPIEVTQILRSAAEAWGIPLTQEMKQLPADTVVGFALKPNYDNSSYYAEDYTMYAFDKRFYEQNKYTGQNAPLNPLEVLKKIEQGREDLYWTRTKEGTEWGSALPGMIFMIGDGPSGTVTNRDSTFYGYQYRFFPQMERGRRYVFAYDVNLKMSSGTYRYPYESTAYKELPFPDGILKSEKGDMGYPDQIGAPRATPDLKLYPYEIGGGQAVWKANVKDPDDALSDKSFKVIYGGLAEPLTAEYEPPSEDIPEEQKPEAYGQISIDLAGLGSNVQQTLKLSADYSRYYEGIEPEDKKRDELLDQPYIQYDQPNLQNMTQDLEAGNKKNALIFNLDIAGQDLQQNVAGVRIDLMPESGESIKKKTLYAPVSYQPGGIYQVELSKDQVSEFFGKKFKVSCRLLSPKNVYGYGVIVQKELGMLMTDLGRYISYDPENIQTPLAEDRTVYNSMLYLSSEIKGHEAVLSIESAYGDKRTWKTPITFTDSGAENTSLLNRETVLFPVGLEEGSPFSINGTFDQIIPVVSNPDVTAALEEALFSFNLTDNVEDLLAEPKTIVFVLSHTEKNENGTSQTIEERKEVLFEELKKEAGGKNQYSYTFKDLKKDTNYKIVVKAKLAGASDKEEQFLDSKGSPFEFPFKTLGEIQVVNPRAQMVNQYYNYKMTNLTYGLSSTTGVKVRYDLYDTTEATDLDNLLKTEPVLSYEELQKYKGGDTYKPYSENKKRFYETETDKLAAKGNFLRLDLSGPIGSAYEAIRLQKGHSYRWRISVYPQGTDYTAPDYKETLAGGGWSSAFQYPQMNTPISQINIRPIAPADPKSEKRELSVQPLLGETPGDANGSIVTTDAYVMLHPETGQPLKAGSTEEKPETAAGENYWLVNKEGQTINNPDKARGAYVVQLLEAKYDENWDPTGDTTVEAEGWDLLDITQYCSDAATAQALSQDAIHGIINIPLHELKSNWEYKVRLYAVLDPELEGKAEIEVPIWEDGKLEDLEGKEGVTLLAEATQRTVGKNGLLIDPDRIDVEQIDPNTVEIHIYDAVGLLDHVKNIQYSFNPKIAGSSESVPIQNIKLSEAETETQEFSDGTTLTTIKLPAVFPKEGVYNAIIRFYGGDSAQELLLNKTYTVRVTQIPVRVSARLPVYRLTAFLPEKKQRMGKENAHA